MTDVTERRRAEDALRASEERFRSLVQNASDIILVLAGDGTIVYESPAVGRVLGFAPEERVGLDALGLIHPEDRDHVRRVLREHRDVPGPFPPLEYRVRDKRGSWRHLEAVGENLLRDPAVGASSSTPATSPSAGWRRRPSGGAGRTSRPSWTTRRP